MLPGLLIGLLLGGSACQEGELETSNQLSPAPANDLETMQADQLVIWEAWENGPHAHTYDLGKGPNTYCARCHAPRNWDPAATIDEPPNCVSCKFEFEQSPRIAKSNPLVPRESWLDIRCDICHEMSEGVADEKIVWWDQAAGQYVPMNDTTALCEKCHADTTTIRHQRDLGSAAHAGFVCTECHDAHSTDVSCTQSGCHDLVAGAPAVTTIPATPDDGQHPEGSQGFCTGASCHASSTVVAWAAAPMHSKEHNSVTCVACHDASGLAVGPLEAGGAWITWRTTELLGRQTTKPFQSHAIQLDVACQRCHYEGNPWELTIQTGEEDDQS